VRAALYETLSGQPCELGPPQFAPTTHAQRTAVANLPCRITPQLTDVLRDAAHDYLAKQGIDEPLNWHPPTDLATDLTLPGPDPNQLDLAAAHRMILHGHTLGRIAASLDTTNDTVRYLLSQLPLARDDHTEHGRHRQTLSVLRQQLPKEQFLRHYVQDGWSLSALADHYGIHRRYLVRLAHAYDIPLRNPNAPPTGITKPWLTEHYHDHGRTANDIANELGLHPNTVLHWCRHYNIPIKPQGPAGHRAARQTRVQAAPIPAILPPR
jgi:DNA-binding CsgD family transcriptional regulator